MAEKTRTSKSDLEERLLEFSIRQSVLTARKNHDSRRPK